MIKKACVSLINMIAWLFMVFAIAAFASGWIYLLFIFVGVLGKLGFIATVLSIFCFYITAPLSPVYVGLQGDWAPMIIIIILELVAWGCANLSGFLIDIGKADDQRASIY